MAWYDSITQLLGNPDVQMGLGIPLAGFGAYELARGRPGGALLGTLGGLGTYFGEQGLQEQHKRLQAQKSFAQQIKLAKQQFPMSRGMEQTLNSLAGVDPDTASRELDKQIQFNRELSKQHRAAKKFELKDIPGIGEVNWDPSTGKFTKIPGATEKFPTGAIQQIIKTHPEWSKLPQSKQLELARAQDKKDKMDILASGAGIRSAIETGAVFPRTKARLEAEKEFGPPKPAKPPKIYPKTGYDPSFDTSAGLIIYTPKPPTGTGMGAALGSVLGTSPIKTKIAVLPGKPNKEYKKGDYIPGKGYWDGN